MTSGDYLSERQMQLQYLTKTKQNRSNQGVASDTTTVMKNIINEDITIKNLIFFPMMKLLKNTFCKQLFSPVISSQEKEICLPFFFSFSFFFSDLFFSRRVFSVQLWLSWNSLCRPGWPQTQKSTCLCLPECWDYRRAPPLPC